MRPLEPLDYLLFALLLLMAILTCAAASYAVAARKDYLRMKAQWDKLPRAARKNIINST